MSTLKVDTIQDTSGGTAWTSEQIAQGRAKAWCSFTVSGGTPSIDDSFNISSMTDNARGDFSFNFATAMANSNYVYLSTSEVGSGNISIAQLVANTLSGRTTAAVRFQYFQIQTLSGGGNTVEPAAAAVAVFGDQ